MTQIDAREVPCRISRSQRFKPVWVTLIPITPVDANLTARCGMAMGGCGVPGGIDTWSLCREAVEGRPLRTAVPIPLSWLQIRPPLLRGTPVGMVQTAEHRHSP